MTEKNVVFIFSGDNDDLESSVNEARDSIDGLKTSTKQASDGMKDGFGKAKKSADNLKKGTADAAKSTAEMKTKVSEAQEALGAMGAAISVVNPELGMMIQQSSALVGGIKGLITAASMLNIAFAPLAITVAAVGAASFALYKVWEAGRAPSRELRAEVKALQDELDPGKIDLATASWEGFIRSIEDLETNLGLVRAGFSAAEIRNAKMVGAARELAATKVAGIEENIAKQREIRAKKVAELEALGGGDSSRFIALDAEIVQLDEIVRGYEGLIVVTREEEAITVERINSLERGTKATVTNTTALKKGTEAAKEAEEQAKALAEAKAEEKRRLSDLGAAMAAISAMEHDATQSTLEGIDLIESKRDDALDALRDRYIEARALTIEDYDGRLEATVAYREAKKAIEDEFDELRIEKEQELSGQRAELQAREIQNSITAAQITADAIGSIADDMFSRRKSNLDSLREYRAKHGQDMSKAEKKRLNKEIKEEKKAMRKIAVAQKAAALIDVAIKTVQGIMSVWATFAAAPPVAAALSAVIGAVGIASGVAIASQAVEFHRGGVVDAKLLDGESVLNRQATQALGNEGVDALNRAGSTSPAAMASSVTLIIGRREAREIVRTDVRSGGLITQEIGRIANTYGNVGLSGLPVLA